MIYNGLELGSFFEIPWTSPCYQVLRGINPILQMVFTFSQMYFVFMNARVSNIWICQKFCTKKTMFIVHILLLCIMNCCLCQIKTQSLLYTRYMLYTLYLSTYILKKKLNIFTTTFKNFMYAAYHLKFNMFFFLLLVHILDLEMLYHTINLKQKFQWIEW